jgi:predicted nucleotidyltransferase
LSTLDEKHLLESASVVLIGSAARGSTHLASDIDVLIVLPSRVGPIHLPYEIDAHIFGRSEFLDRLQRSDDLACWAIRYGKVLSDKSGWWANLLRSRAYEKAWPEWRRKVSHAARSLINTTRLAETGDTDAAWEECGHAAGHIARAILLRAGTFPLSRAELIEQLKGAGHPQLARVLRSLVLGNANERTLSQFTSYVKKWVISLSGDGRRADLSLRVFRPTPRAEGKRVNAPSRQSKKGK